MTKKGQMLEAPWMCLLTVLLGSLLTASAGAQTVAPLPVGEIQSMNVFSNMPTVLSFEAGSAGFLTVVVRGGDVDLSITVTDDLGQQLPDGRADQDLGGSAGSEQLTVAIPRAGTYRAQIGALFGGGGMFQVGGAWLAYPAGEQAVDADGRPDAARMLMPGQPVMDTLNPSGGDTWDWYSVTAAPGAVVTVLVEAPNGDFVLESYAGSNFNEPMDRSDQDMNGVAGNESVTVRPEGNTIYLKVTSYPTSGSLPYTIRMGVL